MMSSKLKHLDVIIFGATGDTGSAAVRLLYHFSEKLNIETWAPCARNLQKLEKNVLAPLTLSGKGKGKGKGKGCNNWKTPIQADSSDLQSLVKMANQAKVVVACAGPYEKFGEQVIVACILSGTHYVDVAGEVGWVNSMKIKYHNAAKIRGVCIVSFCGYDSVPMDLSAWLLANEVRENKDEITLIETFATSDQKGGGGIPSGTINTVLLQVNRLRYKFSFGLLGQAPPKKKTKQEQQQQQQGIATLEQVKNNTIHVGGGAPLLTKRVKENVARDASFNSKRFVSMLPIEKVWSTPHFMAQINMPVVHATAEAEQFPNFQYHERALDGGRNAWQKAPTSYINGYLLPTMSTFFMYLLAAPFVMTPFFDSMVWWYVKNVNAQGKKDETSDDEKKNKKDGLNLNAIQRLMNSGTNTGYVGVRGYGVGKNGTLVQSNFESDYDAGIGFTMLSALTVAGCLLEKDNIAAGENAGFQTPVCAIGGNKLKHALNKAGVRVSIHRVSGGSKM